MSFAGLWNYAEEVKEFWLDNRQLTEEYLEMVKFRMEIERILDKNLEKLINLPFFKLAKRSLLPVAEKIKEAYAEYMQRSRNFISECQDLVIQPLREILQSQEVKFREKIENCKRVEHEKKKLAKHLEHIKEKYWKSCKDTLLATKNKPDYVTKESQNLSTYINCIDTMNRFNLSFIEEMGKNLSAIQSLETDRFQVLQNCLQKMHEIEEKCLKSLIPSLESFPSAICTFNPVSDIEEFIKETKKSESFKLVFVEFSPYGATCSLPKQKVSENEQTLQMIIIKCWEGIRISEEEEETFKKMVATQENRKAWLYFMNEMRIKSQFAIAANGFEVMKDFLRYFLDYVELDMDQSSAKLAIVMSQTFYTERNGEKIYLHTSLSTHRIWESPEIWHLMIDDGIKKEMENYSKFCKGETTEEYTEHMSTLMISQLSSYIHIMKTFSIEPEFIKSISDTLTIKYKMPNLDISDYLSVNYN